MVSLIVPNSGAKQVDGLRPVNLRTDLADLADLIEVAFVNSMDSSGRAAVREMRVLSRMGPGLNMLAGVNDLTQGISLGYVWIADGKLIGNVSIYPTHYPTNPGSTWIIANVAVHPDYRGRGIATQLMGASLEAIIRRGGSLAVLQVDADNLTAQRLYERLGFVYERAWTHWRRPSTVRVPPPPSHSSAYITRPRWGDWRLEYALAQQIRPAEHGGMGWLRPLYVGLFRKSLLSTFTDWFNLRAVERLAIYHDSTREILASVWIESTLAMGSIQLTLLVAPDYEGLYDEALISLAVRRFGTRQVITLEHPADSPITNAVLERYHFRPQRTLVHMHWAPR